MATAEATTLNPPQRSTSFTMLLQLEGMVRAARTREELQFFYVNETRRLVPYQQAIFLIPLTASSPRAEVCAASSVPVVDRTTPLMQWTERLVQCLREASSSSDIRQVAETDCPVECRPDWNEFTSGRGLWC